MYVAVIQPLEILFVSILTVRTVGYKYVAVFNGLF